MARRVPYVVQRTFALGLSRALGNPGANDDSAMAPWAQRSKRAHLNAVENLALFAPATLAVAAAGLSSPATHTACLVYLLARVAHYVSYSLGVPALRTVAHLVGLGAVAFLLFSVLTMPMA